VNLMVFLRPTVIRNSEKSMAVSKGKYKDIRNVQRYKHARGVDLFNEDVLPLLPEWEKQLQQLKQIQVEANEAQVQPESQPEFEAQAE